MGDLFIAIKFFLNALKGYYLSSSYCPEMRTWWILAFQSSVQNYYCSSFLRVLAKNASMNDEGIAGYLMEFHLFKDSVRNGSLGKTAELWVSYMDHV